jgi:hypothetical protein
VADVKDGLDFVEGGVGLLADMGGEFGRVKFAPATPSSLGGEGVSPGGGKVAVDGAFPHREALGGLGARAAALDEPHHPFA